MAEMSTSATPQNCWKCGRPFGSQATIYGGRVFHPECVPVAAGHETEIARLQSSLTTERALREKAERDTWTGPDGTVYYPVDARTYGLECAKHNQRKRALSKAEARAAALAKALEPFSTFAEHAIERLPDGSAIWANCSQERICDWFGPSDFAAALSLKEGC